MKKFLILVLALVMTFAAAGQAFADEASVALKANFSAQSISFTVSESINASSDVSNPTELKFSELVITNNMTTGSLDLIGIKAEGQNGYSVASDNSENWEDLAFNTKKLSVVATISGGSCDLSGEGFSGAVNIPRSSNVAISLSGHTAAVSTKIEGATVANIVATVALHTA